MAEDLAADLERLADPDAPGDALCDHCGRRRPCCYLPDPFVLEIHGREELSWWCRPCHAEQIRET